MIRHTLRDSQRLYPNERHRHYSRYSDWIPKWAKQSRKQWRKFQKRYWNWTIEQFRENYRKVLHIT